MRMNPTIFLRHCFIEMPTTEGDLKTSPNEYTTDFLYQIIPNTKIDPEIAIS